MQWAVSISVQYLPENSVIIDHVKHYTVFYGLFVGEPIKSNSESDNFCMLISNLIILV